MKTQKLLDLSYSQILTLPDLSPSLETLNCSRTQITTISYSTTIIKKINLFYY